MMFAFLADPHWKWGPPEAFARERPVACFFEELAKAPLLDVLRHPVDLLVVPNEVISQRRHLHPPCFPRVIKKRHLATPAERVLMLILLLAEEQSSLHQRLNDFLFRFRILHREPGQPPAERSDEAAGLVHGVERRQSDLLAQTIVVIAVHHRGVPDPASL